MEKRIVVGLIALGAIVGAVAGNALPTGIISTALVVLGLWYGARCVDAEDATGYLVVAIAVGAVAAGDVLHQASVLGGFVTALLDGILDNMATALLSGVASVLVVRTINRLKG